MRESTHRTVLILFTLLGFVSTGLLYYGNGSWAAESDTFYYAALGSSLGLHGTLADISTTPASPVVTSQNGISVVYALFTALHCPRLMLPLAVSLFNVLVLLLSIPAIIGIGKAIGLNRSSRYLLPLAGILSAEVFVSCQFSPMNEAPFVTGSLWLIAILASQISAAKKQPFAKTAAMVFVISMVIVQFRLQAFFIPLAGMLLGGTMQLRTKNGAPIIFLSIISGIACAASLGFVNLLHPGAVPERAGTVVAAQLSWFLDGIIIKLRALWLFYSLLIIAGAILLPKAWRNKNYPILFIALTAAIPLLWIMLLPADAPTVRYTVYSFPLMFILLARIDFMRLFILLVCIWNTCSNTALMFRPPQQEPIFRMFSFVPKNLPEMMAGNAVYLCEPWHDYSRSGWYYTGHPFIRGLHDATPVIAAHDTIYVAGPEHFVATARDSIRICWAQMNRTADEKNMLPFYTDEWGCTLMRFVAGPSQPRTILPAQQQKSGQ